MKRILVLSLFALFLFASDLFSQEQIPHLEQVGDKYQLMVEGKPYLMLAGELGNSTASTMESMEPVWSRLKELNLNTVLLPVYWELFEPEEGEFDYKLIEDLILEARKNDLKLVVLWFGSYKNSMSSHVPSWVKLNQKRFPRAVSKEGESQEILSAFSENNLKADLNAYQHLLSYIKKIDGSHHTVILMQPENEIGMLPSARDYHPLANQKFKEEVPGELMNYIVNNEKTLNPEFSKIWKDNGAKDQGSWEEVFGEGLHTDEIFTAYYFSRFADEVAEAGKKEYPLPAYVNAALNRPDVKPGDYPSGGPLPHLLDVWKAGSPNIDFYSPDFYNPRFRHWNDLYERQGNPLFIPEHNFDNTVAAKALFAIGHYEALGFAPFSIEQLPEEPMTPKEQKLAQVYEIIYQIKPILDANRGQNRTEGVLLDKEVNEMTFTLGEYEFTAEHTFNLGWEPNSDEDIWEPSAAIIIQTAKNEFFYAGYGVSLKMTNLKNPNSQVGILKTDRGYFSEGTWNVFQHLNGDQTHQGRHIRSFIDEVSIQRFTLYEYD